jgi:hypothetical protein
MHYARLTPESGPCRNNLAFIHLRRLDDADKQVGGD